MSSQVHKRTKLVFLVCVVIVFFITLVRLSKNHHSPPSSPPSPYSRGTPGARSTGSGGGRNVDTKYEMAMNAGFHNSQVDKSSSGKKDHGDHRRPGDHRHQGEEKHTVGTPLKQNRIGTSDKLIEYGRYSGGDSSSSSLYTKYPVRGYVSQLSHVERERIMKTRGKDFLHDEELANCDNYAVDGEVEYWQTDMYEDYKGNKELFEGRRILLDKFPQYLPWAVSDHDLEDSSEWETVEKRWYQFGPSAVWLEEIERYLVLTRYMHAPDGSMILVRCSFGKMDLYDRDWNRMKNERVLYNDINSVDLGHGEGASSFSIPKEALTNISLLERHVEEQLKKELHYDFHCDEVANKACLNKNSAILKIVEKRKEPILDKYSVKFPTFINVDMDIDEGQWIAGVEDPRVTIKQYPNKEPLVLFNMVTGDGKRYMHAYYPFKSKNKQIKFTINDKDQESMEKNWTPFFLEGDEHIAPGLTGGGGGGGGGALDPNPLNRGYIRFIYNYNPLTVLKCSLNDGRCDIIFDNYKMLFDLSDGVYDDMLVGNKEDESDKILHEFNKLGAVRGGAQLVKLPEEVLPHVNGVNLWVTFAKTHLDNCGCGERFYRPLMVVYSESAGVYMQEFIIPGIDFDLDIMGWSREDTNCGGYNVLNPNSISSWDVIEHNKETGLFNDYMTILTSEADYRSRRVVIRGMLNFIIKAYKSRKITENDLNLENPMLSKKMFYSSIQCISKNIEDKCRSYGESHPEVFTKKE